MENLVDQLKKNGDYIQEPNKIKATKKKANLKRIK